MQNIALFNYKELKTLQNIQITPKTRKKNPKISYAQVVSFKIILTLSVFSIICLNLLISPHLSLLQLGLA